VLHSMPQLRAAYYGGKDCKVPQLSPSSRLHLHGIEDTAIYVSCLLPLLRCKPTTPSQRHTHNTLPPSPLPALPATPAGYLACHRWQEPRPLPA
jgi:hypothetical protein